MIKIRPTRTIMTVLAAIDQEIGYYPTAPAICESTGLGIARVYPALDRLMKARWVLDFTQTEDGLTIRRYRVSAAGRDGYILAQAYLAGRPRWCSRLPVRSL